MIPVVPSASFTFAFGLPTSGVAASAAVTVYNADGTVRTARAVGTGISEVGATGLYRKTLTAPATPGTYYLAGDDGSHTPNHIVWEDLVVASASDLSSISASLDAIRAKTDMLGSGFVLVTLPLVETEPDVLRLVRGDDYLAAQGRAIGWELEGVPNLLGTTVNFRIGISGGAPGLTQACVPTSNEDLYAELTAAQTASLTAKKYTYELEQVVAGKKATLLRGNLEMTDDLSAT